MGMAMLLGGGYATRKRALTSSEREAIFKRDKHICRICKRAKATQIDHMKNVEDINNSSNLQAVCDRCHRDKTAQSFVPVKSGSPEDKKAKAIRRRVFRETPARPSDDDVNWKKLWPGLASQRRANMGESKSRGADTPD
jgi:hypothetical protein